jgi:hypothetical protein
MPTGRRPKKRNTAPAHVAVVRKAVRKFLPRSQIWTNRYVNSYTVKVNLGGGQGWSLNEKGLTALANVGLVVNEALQLARDNGELDEVVRASVRAVTGGFYGTSAVITLPR